jgi:3-isopropylmalate/(R)-2-methylmalate dehydratase small subunit
LILKGKVYKYGANVDTDAIIPARYLNVSEPEELAKHCMEDIDADFISKVRPGDIIVAESNFGCGSSREHAPVAIKASGVSAVIASSFARIFFRNSINIGLPLLESDEASKEIAGGDIVEINLEEGTIRDITRNKTYKAKPYPGFMMDIVNSGGLVAHTRKKISGGL